MTKNSPRESNLELLRIIAMLGIIAHHFVVNSTVTDLFSTNNLSVNAKFLVFWGMWGKTAINSFILISGYFLCTSKLTWQRYIKLLAEILFYRWIIMLIFAATGYEPLTFKLVYHTAFSLLIGINNSFVASFMIFYAGVPIYNKLIRVINKRQHGLMLIGLITMFSIASTIFHANTMNEPFWYMTLYFVAAYIRLYPIQMFNSLKIAIIFLLVSIILAYGSIVLQLVIHDNHGSAYKYVSDSNKLLAFTVGFFAFLTAKNAPKFYNKFINIAAAGTFGVLLIHASSDTMRKWLWQEIIQVPKLYYKDFAFLIVISVITPIIIFTICSAIDYMRRKYIEYYFMEWLNNIFNKK